MAEELQHLLDKINREGVEKAENEAARIIAAAKEEAATLVATAKNEAAAEKAAAEAAAKMSAHRAEETIRQAARDTVLSVESAVTKLLESVLVRNVDAALSDPATAVGLARDAIRAVAGDGEVDVAAGAKLAESLRAQLAAETNVKVVTDDTLGTGFSVRVDGGRVEHEFTGSVVSNAIASRLRAELAKFLK